MTSEAFKSHLVNNNRLLVRLTPPQQVSLPGALLSLQPTPWHLHHFSVVFNVAAKNKPDTKRHQLSEAVEDKAREVCFVRPVVVTLLLYFQFQTHLLDVGEVGSSRLWTCSISYSVLFVTTRCLKGFSLSSKLTLGSNRSDVSRVLDGFRLCEPVGQVEPLRGRPRPETS